MLSDKSEKKDNPASVSSQPMLSTTSAAAATKDKQSPTNQDNTVPKKGTVLARLAAFEKK